VDSHVVDGSERSGSKLVRPQGCPSGGSPCLLFRLFAGTDYLDRHRSSGPLFGPAAVTGQVMSSLKEMLGENGAKAVEAIEARAHFQGGHEL